MNFQTERVLNSLDRVEASKAVDKSSNNKGFFLDYGCYFDSNNIVDKKIYKTEFADGVYEKWELNLIDLVVGKPYVFELDVQLNGEVRSDFNRYAINNGKPYRVQFEIPTGTTAPGDFATKKIIDGLTTSGHSDIKVAEKSDYSTSKTLEISGTMYSMVFTKLSISELVPSNGDVYGTDYAYKLVVAGEKKTDAKEPFGTAWFITKNLRLPTDFNTRFMSPNADEMPIDGAKYTQYFFQYRVTRDITGTDAVGQELTSTTEHIIYVKDDLVANFETIVKSDTVTIVK